jgi:hypothetical protein
MKYSEYLKFELQLKGQLSRSNSRFFLFRETIVWAGVMALVLTIAETTPWPLGQETPLGRLFFILVWSLAMAWWELSRIRQADAPERAKSELPTAHSHGGEGSPSQCLANGAGRAGRKHRKHVRPSKLPGVVLLME